ncbi:hypothetical protein NA78x_001255 [Anatilimnocola sp. NA78]|uniref:hypothetical protein n=1 Tax=Anatilimnocola sp. NA78 TaxID=3415683 RepID=UPI003CE5C88A
MKLRFASLMLASMLMAAVCQQASAQYPGRYMPPAGPVMPNALNYFRRDVGVLDPYNAFVQPRRQLEQQLGTLNYQQMADNRRVEQEIGNVRKSLAAPTGTNAGFMNHRQYFNVPRPQAAARR